MSTRTPADRFDEARLARADLRLALAQTDELIRKAEAILLRNRAQQHR
jgi:hypothetical protein